MKRMILFLQTFALAAHCFVTVSASYLEYDSIEIRNNVKTVVSENFETLCLHDQATKNLEIYHNQNGSWNRREDLMLSSVSSFILSKDGKMLSILTRNGALNVYEKNGLDNWNTIPEFTSNEIDLYTASSDGKKLCIKKFNGILQVFEKQHGVWQADYLPSCQDITNVYFSEDQKILIALIANSRMCFLTRPSINSQWQIVEGFDQLQNVEDFKVSENGKTLCIKTDEKFFIVEQDNNGAWNKIKELPNAQKMRSYVISSDGTSVIIKTDKSIIINEQKEGFWFQTKKIKTSGCLDLSSSGKLIAVIQNKHITLYEQDETTWQLVYQHSTKIKSVHSIQVFNNRNVSLKTKKEIKTMIFTNNPKRAKS